MNVIITHLRQRQEFKEIQAFCYYSNTSNRISIGLWREQWSTSFASGVYFIYEQFLNKLLIHWRCEPDYTHWIRGPSHCSWLFSSISFQQFNSEKIFLLTPLFLSINLSETRINKYKCTSMACTSTHIHNYIIVIICSLSFTYLNPRAYVSFPSRDYLPLFLYSRRNVSPIFWGSLPYNCRPNHQSRNTHNPIITRQQISYVSDSTVSWTWEWKGYLSRPLQRNSCFGN